MRECSSCHFSNDDKAQFCAECGQRFSAGTKSGGEGAPRPRLHSPILGEMESTDSEPRHQQAPAKKNKPSAHLRSPLLGGGDNDDQDYDDPRPVKPIKAKEQQGAQPRPKKPGGLRSPLLGGADEDEGNLDYEEDFPMRDRDDRSPFPHRSHANTPDQDQPKGPRPKAHLRSPLLGSEDDYDESGPVQHEQPMQRGAAGGPKPKLHSPIFDRSSSSSGGGGYGGDFYDDEEPEEITDPHVLRSPLLAARSRVPDKPSGQPADAMPPQGFQANQPPPGQAPNRYPNTPGNAQYQGAQPAPSPYQQAPAPQAPPQNQYAQPSSQQYGAPSGYPPQQPLAGGDPYSKGQALFPTQTGFGQPQAPSAPQPVAQPAPSAQFAPESPPSGITPDYQFGTGNTPTAASAAPVAPPLGSPGQPPPLGVGTMGGGSPTVPMNALPISQAGLVAPKHDLPAPDENALHSSKPLEPASKPIDEPSPSKSKSRFADLNDSTFGGDTIHESVVESKLDAKPRSRKLPGSLAGGDDLSTSKRFDPAPAEEHHYAQASSEPPQPIMVLFIPACLAAVGKLWYLAAFASQIMGQMPWLVSEVGQVALCIGVIIFAAKGGKS